ncbi:MAG: molybdate ABC transporter substrate-binding protein [Bosea sp. (in: a-proteobacteria)]|uniref:molybdate ABC transporter substrate-binding protein n=1 Tax=Bosea sp. (in: a-proteobacteria) TaxID=1871050 RepID=UPI003F7C4030
MESVSILSGGAAMALVSALEPRFRELSGMGIDGTFGAVGAMRAKLEAGHATDVVILTAAIIGELANTRTVLVDSVADIGDVATAIAVRDRDHAPVTETEADLRQALLAADTIYFPDPKLATAGIHFARVLEKLGIAAELADRLRPFPNGATAMAALAASGERNPIGCTQVTEIRATRGTRVVAPLPAGFDLVTRYTAAICAAARHREQAKILLELLASDEAAEQRHHAGFT